MKGNYETKLKDTIEPVSIKKTEIILGQMKSCVCKIDDGQKKGTGFFLEVPYKNKKLTLLITNNHVLGINEISQGKSIVISLNNKEITKSIKIDSKRKVYTDENFDITIIELDKSDKIEHFLTLDKTIIERINSERDEISINSSNIYNNLYEKESIYILNYVEKYMFLMDY